MNGKITILVDNNYAGDGDLRNGTIDNCPIPFEWDIYEMIEDAIQAGKKEVKAYIDEVRSTISWGIYN